MAGIGTANPCFSCYKKPRQTKLLTEILLEVA
jgi:hypothetical protein